MVFGIFGLGKGKKKEATQTKEPNPIEILRQEKQNLEERLAQAQTENHAQQIEYDKLREEHEKAQQSILKTAETQVQKEVSEIKQNLNAEYQTKIADLEKKYKARVTNLVTAKQDLEKQISKLKTQLKAKERQYSSDVTGKFTEFQQRYEAEISGLKETIDELKQEKSELDKRTKQHDEIYQKMNERIRSMIKTKKSGEELTEGQVIEVMIFTRAEEKRRKSCYNAATSDDEIIYVRTLMEGIEGLDAKVRITSSQPEARLITNSGAVPEVGEEVDIQFAEKTQKGMSALYENGEVIITNVGENVTKLDKPTKSIIYGEKDGIYLARRV